MVKLKLLSGGAAQGLVSAIAPQFERRTRTRIGGDFGAVGVMAKKLRTGDAVDVMILTAALIEELAGEGLVVPASIAAIGTVETAVAVRSGDAVPAIGDENGLRVALLASDAIFVPDTVASTAGIHVAKILRQLGIDGQVKQALKEFPNGATAMRELARSVATRPIGCTQATEIIATEALTLAGPLPPACALSTIYSAAVTTRAADVRAAKVLVDMLASPEQRAARAAAGFGEVSLRGA